MMSQLTQMVFIDSFSEGRLTRIALGRNTNLNGRNGNGKTTLLRVLPVFFGTSPGEMVREEGVNQSFVDYYLPRNTSYIVFEYQRHEQKCCVILSRRGAAKAVGFRFVSHAFNENWFFKVENEQEIITENQELARSIKIKGIDISTQFGIDDYRLIIQSGHPFYHSNKKKQKIINQVRARFSFPAYGNAMDNIHLVSAAILERKPSIKAIKEVLESILINQGDLNSNELSLQLPGLQIDDWVKGRNAWLAVEAQKGNIDTLIKMAMEDQEQRKQLAKLKSMTLELQNRFNKKHREYTEQNQLNQQELSAQNTTLSDTEKNFRKEREKLQSELDEKQRQIKNLNDEKRYFEQQNISEKEVLIKRLPQINDYIAQKAQQRNELESGLTDLTAHYACQQTSAKDFYQDKKQSIDDYKYLETARFREQQSELEKDKDKKIKRLERESKVLIEQLNKKLQEAKENLGYTRASLKNIQAPKEIELELQEYQSLLSDIENDRQEEQSKYDAFLIEQREVEKKQDSELENQRNLAREITHLKEQMAKTRELFQPKEGSLLEFLRHQVEGWEDTIGRVIDPELLKRTDLHPRIISEVLSFYGLELNLDGIKPPQFTDSAELQKALQLMMEQLEQLEKKQQASEQLSQNYQKSLKQLGNDLARQKMLIHKLAEEARQKQKEREQVLIRRKMLIEQEKSTMQAQLSHLETRIAQYQEDIRTQNKNTDEQVKRVIADCDNKIQTLRAKEATLIENCQKQQQEVLEQYQQKQAAIKAEEADAIKAKGFDDKALTRVRQELTAAESEHKTALEAQVLVSQYHEFMEQQWPEHARLSIIFDDLQEHYQHIKQTQQQELNTLNNRIERLKNSIYQTREQIDRLDTEKNLLESLLYKMTDIEPSETTPELTEIHTSSFLTTEHMTLKNDMQARAKSAQAIYNQVRQVLREADETQPGKFYKQIINELSRNHIADRDEWLFVSGKLNEYLSEGHGAHRDLLRSNAQVVGQDISDFNQQLRRVHSKIEALGRQVTAQTKAVITSFDAIDDLQVRVTSSVDKLDYWDSLKSFNQIHEQWMALGSASLPGDDYLNLLVNIKNMMGSSGITVNIKNSFDIAVRVNDQGQIKTATNDKQMATLSSNGLSYIYLMLVFMALVNMLRQDKETVITWAIDELRDLDVRNAIALIKLLNNENIMVLSAFPDPDYEILSQYEHTYLLGRKRKLSKFIPADSNDYDIKNLLSKSQSDHYARKAHSHIDNNGVSV